MSKISFDDYLEEDPMFTPCIHCGCLDFYMDWGDTIYRCRDCDEPIDAKSQKNVKRQKEKTKVRKFKDYEGD